MTKRLHPAILLVAALVLSAGCSKGHARRADAPGGEPKVRFASKVPAGEYEASIEGDMVIETIKPSSQKVSIKMGMDVGASLQPADAAGNQPAAFWFRRMRFEMNGMTIDTDEKIPGPDAPGPFAAPVDRETAQRQEAVRLFKKLIGPRVSGVLDKDGNMRVTKDELAEAIRDDSRLSSAFSSGFEQIGELAEMFRAAERARPAIPVGPGAVWHRMASKDVPNVGKVAIEMEYELVRLEDTPQGQVAHLRSVSNLGDSLKGLRTKGVTIGAADLVMTGDMRILLATGLATEWTHSLKGSMEMSQGSQDAKVRMDVSMRASVKPAGR